MTDISEELGKCLQWACSPRGGNNFYGRVLNGCGRRASPGLGTCGVTLDKEGRYVLLWDPNWFEAQDDTFRLLVIVHEAAHLILRHIERGILIRRAYMNDKVSERIREVMNVAADMAVNDIAIRPMMSNTEMTFKDYYDDLIWPESRKYPRGQSMEDYLVLLLKDLKDHGWSPQDKDAEIPQQSSAIGQPTSNDGDGEGSGEGKSEGEGSGEGKGAGGSGKGKVPGWFQNLLNRKHTSVDWGGLFEKLTDGEIQRAVDRARREAQKIAHQAAQQTKKSRGVIPGNIEAILEELLSDPVIPWQEILRNQIRSAISHKLVGSMVQPNNSLLHLDEYEPYPGYQRNFTFNILAAFDTSGSMSTEDFLDCCSELRGLLLKEEGVSVRLLHFDWNIQHEEKLTTDSAEEFKRTQTRYGCGGTSFEGPLRYAMGTDSAQDWASDAESEDTPGNPFDLMLMFTDGYAPIPLPALNPKIPLFWILTHDGQSDSLMHTIIRMEN